jgi:hypothetical protein
MNNNIPTNTSFIYEQIKQIYRQQLRRWAVDQDSLFILAPEDSLYDPKHAIPMATYAEITAFYSFLTGGFRFQIGL